MSILVADLVLLQALWKILNWCTTKWLEHKDPTAKFCAGCLAQHDGSYVDDIELGALDAPLRTNDNVEGGHDDRGRAIKHIPSHWPLLSAIDVDGGNFMEHQNGQSLSSIGSSNPELEVQLQERL